MCALTTLALRKLMEERPSAREVQWQHAKSPRKAGAREENRSILKCVEASCKDPITRYQYDRLGK